jgi:putative transposase
MKIVRSVKCSLKFARKSKLALLDCIMDEYSRCVNVYISNLNKELSYGQLTKEKLDFCSDSWLSSRMLQNAAREALGMLKTAKDDKLPVHRAKIMRLNANICSVGVPSKEFDLWLNMRSIGSKLKLDIPLKKHRNFHKWATRGMLLKSYVISRNYVKFTFEIQVAPKKEVKTMVGLDTGIVHLATLSTEKHLGSSVHKQIDIIKRRKQGSKGQSRARCRLRQIMGEVAKEICSEVDLVVVEKLKNLNKDTKVKRRLTKNIRRSLGASNISYWLRRLQMTCEEMSVSFRTVYPHYTSQRCFVCGHTERKNRQDQSTFLCQNCGHTDNADVNAAKNILDRFITGKYGSCYRPLYFSNI